MPMGIDFDEFLSNRSGDREPLLSFKWMCTELPFGFETKYVESVDLPFPSLNIKQGLFGAGTFTYYPGFEEISAFDIQFYEDSRARTLKWLKDWKERIRDPRNGAFYLPTNYKYDITVHLLDTTGKPILKAICKNCWPTTKGNWNLNYQGGGEALKVHQNFSVDRLELEWLA